MARFKVTTAPDNTPDPRDSIQSLYNKALDREMFNLVDSENIKLSGSRVLVYKYAPSDEIDDVYMESRQKAISPEPIVMFAHYDPRPIEENLGQFGVEIENNQIFIFNKADSEHQLGRVLIPGDILKTDFQNMKFEVFEVQEDSFEAYGIYHLLVHTKLLRDTEGVYNEDFFDRSDRTGGRIKW